MNELSPANSSGSSPEHTNRLSQLSPRNRRSVRSLQSTSSPVPPNISDIREAKMAITHGGAQQQEEEEPSLQLEDLRRTDKGSVATTATANSSWSQLPIAQPIDVAAHESSMSLLPNSGVIPISESQIDRGEVSSIRDNMVRRASDRTSSGNLKSVSQLTGTTETSSSGVTPHQRILETNNEQDDDDEEVGRSSQQTSKKKEEAKSGLSNTTLGIIAALVVLTIAIVAGVCLSGQCEGSDANESSSSTPSPTVFVDRRTRIAEYIQSITKSEVPLVYPVPQSRNPTNQERALKWLLDEDPLELQGFADELDRVRQRFALSSIWFLTSPESFWKDTTNWLSGAHECDWANVICGESFDRRQVEQVKVEAIDLGDDSIAGVIPDDLALLSDGLEHLQLAYNRLVGTIPTSLGLLTKLTLLDVEENYLSGSVPSALGNLSLLRVLRLSKNDVNGTLPEELGKLTNMKTLNIAGTQISGPVHSWLGNLSSLEYIWLQDTLLSGTLPSSLASFQRTKEILLYNTRMNGTVPFCEPEDPSFFTLVADCDEVECSCCTACCPRSSGIIPVYRNC